jgi:cytochrome bd-type quinol oxidase subunit 2
MNSTVIRASESLSAPSRQQLAARRGYIAIAICGLCVGLNILAYSPGQSFEQAESTEFTVTLFLLLVFVISLLVATFFVIRNRRDIVLMLLLLVTFAFAWSATTYAVSTHRSIYLSYAICTTSLATLRLVAQGRGSGVSGSK